MGWIYKIKRTMYPRLFENPNAINPSGETESWISNDYRTLPFSYYGGKMYVGSFNANHAEMMPSGLAGDDRGRYSGRLFLKQKIVTFWHFPEDRKKLEKVLADLRAEIDRDKYDEYKGLHVDFSEKGWRIEIPSKGFEKLKKYPTGTGFPEWGEWDPEKGDHRYVKIEDYGGGHERSEKEIQSRHTAPPSAGKKEVPAGFGSKSPEYAGKRRWQMATLGAESKQEPFYPKLLESDE